MPRALFLPLFTSSVTASVSIRSLVGGTIGTVLLGGPGASSSPHTALSCRLSLTAFFDDFLRLSTTFATKNWTISTNKLSVPKSFCRILMRLGVSVWRSCPRERSSLVGSRRLSEVQSVTVVARRLESIYMVHRVFFLNLLAATPLIMFWVKDRETHSVFFKLKYIYHTVLYKIRVYGALIWSIYIL